MIDLDEAERVRKFARLCQPSQGKDANKPVEFLPWQFEKVVKPFFSTKTEDGLRQYRQLSLWLPRRNGKSFLMSIMALYFLLADGEPGPNVVVVANSIQQAKIIFDEAAAFVEQSEVLSSLVWVRRNINTLELKKGYGELKVLSGEGKAKLGKNISAAFIDEVAENSPHMRTIYDAIMYSQSNRSQPVLASISSAGVSQDSLGRELYKVAKDVLTGVKEDPQLLAVIFEASPEDPWDSPKTAEKANPSYGLTIRPDDFESAIIKAKNNPRLVNKYKCYRLNQWVSNLEAWLQPAIVDSCFQPFNEEQLHGQPAWIGIDLARGLHDLSAYTILIPHDDKLFLITRFFTPQDSALMKEEKENIPYTRYAGEGWVTLSAGDTINLSIIKTKLLEDAQLFQVQEIGYDPNLANTLGEELRDEYGISTTQVIQSYPSLSDAVLTTEKFMYEKKFVFNNPLLRSHFLNAGTKEDNQSRVILDKQSTAGRIDGAQSTVIAVHRYTARVEEEWGIAWC